MCISARKTPRCGEDESGPLRTLVVFEEVGRVLSILFPIAVAAGLVLAEFPRCPSEALFRDWLRWAMFGVFPAAVVVAALFAYLSQQRSKPRRQG